MRKLFGILAALLLVTALAGCGGKQDDAPGASLTQSAPEGTVESQTGSGKSVTVTAADGSKKTATLINGFYQFETAGNLKVNVLTLDITEYEQGGNGEITGRLNAEGVSDASWIGIVPSDIPHGDDERNDTYDTDYRYLSELENGSFALAVPDTAGNYDLRICDGTSEVAYMSFIVK